jgi:hypothetical protein
VMANSLLLAHGGGLIGTYGLMFLAGVGAVICFITGPAISMDKTEAGRRKGRRFVIAGFVCVVIAILSPLIAQIRRLP